MNIQTLFIVGSVLFGSFTVMAHDYQDDYHDNHANAVYRIEMHNQANNQWLSPCLCALHKRNVRLFQVGQAATTGQATFSEDGFNGVWAKELRENPDVYAVLQCGSGLTPPDAYRVEHIKGPKHARLTCAAMPVTTNDVLTVVQNVKLPKRYYRTRTYYSNEWDLGSEHNNYSPNSIPEDSLNLVPEGPDNPVTISENVVFGPTGRPAGVPSLLSPFTRTFIGDQGNTIAEGTMRLFTRYQGSDMFDSETYGWTGSASHFTVTRTE